MEWKQVMASSSVAAIAYDEGKRECWIKFNNGAIYAYEDVSPEEFHDLNGTPSKGRYVQIVLRRGKAARKESDPPKQENE
jgi:hypothetical protein